MNTTNNDTSTNQQGHLPEPSPLARLLTALGVAIIAYFFLGGKGFLACLLAGIGHTLTPLVETLWVRYVYWLHARIPKPMTPTQVRALILCGVVLAVALGVPCGHWLNQVA